MTSIYYKQYILTNQTLKIDGMIRECVKEGVNLYYDNSLCVSKISRGDDTFWVLGHAFRTDIKDKAIFEDASEDDIRQATKCWTGRWLLLSTNELITDVSSLMSAYYHEKNGQWFVSSSLAVMSSITGLCRTHEPHKVGLTWQLLPDSYVDQVHKLYPTQRLRFEKNTIITVFDNWILDYSSLTTSEKVELLAGRLCNGIHNMAKCSDMPLRIALTAGKDSRLVLAAALSEKVDFEAYTFEHSNMLCSDFEIPTSICKHFKVPFSFIKKNKRDNELWDDYLSFCNVNTTEVDGLFYACHQYDQLPKDCLLVRGSLFEAGQQYGRKTMGANDEDFINGFQSYYSSSLDEYELVSFRRWLNYQTANPIPYIDLRDRFYLEQRVGGWVSAIEQSLDVTGRNSIHIANCAEIMSILLSSTVEERNQLAMSFKTIDFLYPELMKWPFNKRCLRDKFRIYINGIKKRIRI